MADTPKDSTPVFDPVGKNILETVQKADHYNLWLYNLIKPELKGNIIEIGSGIGNFTSLLLKDKFRVTATDFNPHYLETLSQKHPGLTTFNFDLAAGNTPRGILNQFDTAICFNVLEHISVENQALQNIKNTLKAGGKLIILVPAFQLAFGLLDRNLGHFRRYTKKSLKNTLIRNGFSVETARYLNPLGLIGWWINGKILRRGDIADWQITVFELLSRPILYLEKFISSPFGLSVMTVARI